MKNKSTEWFRTWFDSPYYSLLYNNRDEAEADNFLNNLIRVLDLPDRARVLDLACGKGRHSIILHNSGFRVLGIDLSINSISAAKKHETSGLQFLREDMRTFDLDISFDAILNLFTSFGYFENPDDNIKVLERVKHHLKKGGVFVMDYFNASCVVKEMKLIDHKKIGKVNFSISKKIEGRQIVKTIEVNEDQRTACFQEQVQLFTPDELIEMISATGMVVTHTFGDYQLNPFQIENSPRIIIISRL